MAGEGTGARQRDPISLAAPARDRDPKDVLRASFDRFALGRGSSDVPWLALLRTAAMARFAERGFPTTATRPGGTRTWPPSPAPRSGGAGADVPTRRSDGAPSSGCSTGPQAVFVNGRFLPRAAPPWPRSLRGVEVAASPRRSRPRAPAGWSLSSGGCRARRSGFTDLNTAFVDDGAVVFVAEKTVAREPAPGSLFSPPIPTAPPRCRTRGCCWWPAPRSAGSEWWGSTTVPRGTPTSRTRSPRSPMGAGALRRPLGRPARTAAPPSTFHSVSARARARLRFRNQRRIPGGGPLPQRHRECASRGRAGSGARRPLRGGRERRHTDATP